MKRLEILFWATITAGAILLVVAFINGEKRNLLSDNSPHYSAIQRLGEMARTKYHHAHQHLTFAEVARQEREYSTERLFRAISFSEKVQCRICQEAIHNLGGRYLSPIAIPPQTNSTAENLATAIQRKYEHRNHRGKRILQRSIASGNRYVTRILVWCDANDAQQITLLRSQKIANSGENSYYWVCPKCGYISEHALPTPICPHCNTDEKKFVRF